MTSKLHEFKAREQELIERVSAATASNGRQSPGGHELEDCSDAELPPHLKSGFGPDGGGHHHGHHQQAPVPPLIAIPPPPRSPLKSVVRAYLPNEQRTIVQVKPGQTVREALSKAMKLRKLDPSTCAVYRCTQPEVLQNKLHAYSNMYINIPHLLPKGKSTMGCRYCFSRRWRDSC